MNHLTSVLSTLVLLLGGLSLSSVAATADDSACVPSDAWTETVEHPAVTHEETVEVADGWQRYSWTGGPHTSDSPPAFPSDDWQPNVKGDPHGVGVEGAYFRSHGNSGNGDWFYLEALTRTEVVVVVDEEAWTETIEHPAVTCPEVPEEPEEPTDPGCPDGTIASAGGSCVDCESAGGACGEQPETPEVPVDKPKVPKDVQEQIDRQGMKVTSCDCLGGSLVTKASDAQGNLFSSTVTAHPACSQRTASGGPIIEEGM